MASKYHTSTLTGDVVDVVEILSAFAEVFEIVSKFNFGNSK